MGQNKEILPQALENIIPQEIFKAEVRSWAERIGVEPHSITLRVMKNKWASCTSKGNLSFNTELLHQSAEFRHKTIVHELLHLKYPKHSKLFRAMEKAYLEEK